MKIAADQIEARADRARAALNAAQTRLGSESFPTYEALTQVVDLTALTKVWETIDYLADVCRERQPEATDEQVIEFLTARITERVFGFFGARSSNAQSNLVEHAEHLAWIEAGRDEFGIGRGW